MRHRLVLIGSSFAGLTCALELKHHVGDARDTLVGHGQPIPSDRWVIATGPELACHAWLIPGREAHWAKLAYEKWFLATRRRGHV